MNIQSVRKPIHSALKARGFSIIKNAAVIDTDEIRFLIRVDRGPTSGAFYLDFGIWFVPIAPEEKRPHMVHKCHIYDRMNSIVGASEQFWELFSSGSIDAVSDEFVEFVDEAAVFGRRNSDLDRICEDYASGRYEDSLVPVVARRFLESRCASMK